MKICLAAKMVPDWDSMGTILPTEILDKGSRSTKAYLEVFEDARRHMYYSFAYEMDDSDALLIASKTSLKVCHTPDDRYFGLLTGAIPDWEQAFVTFCNSEYSRVMRAFFNAIMGYMESDGVKFQTIRRNELRDGTFEIKQWK